MGSHSEHGAFIRGYASTLLGAGYGPASAGATRDGLVNNARHLFDQSGQMVAQLVLPSSPGYVTQASPSTTRYQLLDDGTAYTWPLRLRADTGNSFLVVLRLRVSISVAGTASFRVVLGRQGDEPYEPLVDSTFVQSFTTTSTSATTVEPTPLYFTAAQLARARNEAPSLRGDGSLGIGRYVGATLTVWAKSSAGAPRLHGLMAREYVGA